MTPEETVTSDQIEKPVETETFDETGSNNFSVDGIPEYAYDHHCKIISQSIATLDDL
jgi:hypothetical protein